eukprot:3336963-Alexandrium_andersonii.AAC.1
MGVRSLPHLRAIRGPSLVLLLHVSGALLRSRCPAALMWALDGAPCAGVAPNARARLASCALALA